MTTMRPPRAAPAPFAPPRDGAFPGGAVHRRRAALLLSVLALAAMLVSSVVGLAVDGLYGNPESLASMLRANDLVTLVVVVPVLALALAGVRRGSTAAGPRSSTAAGPRGSTVAELIWVGMLAASVYTWAYYVFPTAFNDAFLLHVAGFATALFALVLAVSTVDVAGLARRVHPRTPARWIAVLLALLAAGLGGMWIAYSVQFALTGDLPEGSALVESPSVVHLGFVLDLALLVPGYAVAAVLLWRRAAWGYVIAALVLVSGTVHQIGYLVALPFQAAAGVPGATAVDPMEPPIAMAFLVATAALLTGVRRRA